MLVLLAGASLAGAVGCDTGSAAGEIPEETAGPYPGDGSNGTNVLAESGIIQSDIQSSFGWSSTRAQGIPLSVSMTIQNFDQNKAAYAGAAVYLWHCDRSGQYSMYSSAFQNENYLRGVQEAGENGPLRFTTIVPGCYSGRWPHIPFEVYPSLAKATNSKNKIATSQLALPEATAREVYATAGYEQSLPNLSQVRLDCDNVFGDGYDLQIPKVTGNPSTGYALTFTCAV